jgi:hypothetical protein
MAVNFDQIAVHDTDTQLSTATVLTRPMNEVSFQTCRLFQEALRWAKRSPTCIFYVVIWRTPDGTKLRVVRTDYERIPMRSAIAINNFVKAFVNMWMDVREARSAFIDAGIPNRMAAFGQISAFKAVHEADEPMALLTAMGKVLASWIEVCKLDPSSIVVPDYNYVGERYTVKYIIKQMCMHLPEDSQILRYGTKRPHTECYTENTEVKVACKRLNCRV